MNSLQHNHLQLVFIYSELPSQQPGLFKNNVWQSGFLFVICFLLFDLHFVGGGFNISPLKSRNGRIRTQVQHLMQIDLKGWGVGYVPSFQQHCLLHMLNSVAGTNKLLNKIYMVSLLIFCVVHSTQRKHLVYLIRLGFGVTSQLRRHLFV